MQKARLKNKLMFGSLTTVIIVMVVATIVVSIVVNRQNRKASAQQIEKALDIVREDIKAKRRKLLSDTRQMASVNNMGSKVKFLFKYKKEAMQSMTENTYKEITNDIFHIASVSNLWKVAVFDEEGDVISMAVQRERNSFVVAYMADLSRGVFKYDALAAGAQLSKEAWKETEKLDQKQLEIQFRDGVPSEEQLMFITMENYVCLAAYVPVLGDVINRETGNIEKKQFGVAVSVRKLNSDFVKQMKMLTGLEINIFTKSGYSVGTQSGYRNLVADHASQSRESLDLSSQSVEISDVDVANDSYLQGILPIYQGAALEGIFAVLHSKRMIIENTWQIIKLLIIVFLACIVLILPISWFFAFSLTNPIQKVVAGLKDIAQGEGDLTYRISVTSTDEVGELAKWCNAFMAQLNKMIKNIALKADILNRSSADLSGLSSQMSQGAFAISDNAKAVSTSSGEMSLGIASVATAMEQTSTNVGMVAASVEEMSSTIQEIAQNAETARDIAGDAVDRVKGSSNKVGELGQAAQDITKVTETINEISEQTNLLALNATIEAARAGDAGKGFAVVANEIKELAKQTAEATEDIKDKIQEIQRTSKDTVSEIVEILKVINSVNEIVSNIFNTVEEQAITTQEIAKNVSQASVGIHAVNKSLAGSSVVSKEIAKDVANIEKSTDEMRGGTTHVRERADELNRLSDELQQMVAKFNVG